jgi:hypothetical protein
MGMFIRLLTLVEALVFMLPMSVVWLLGCYVLVGQPAFDALRQGSFPRSPVLLFGVWLAFCGMGLCALWEFFLRHHLYTLRSIPLRVKVGIVLGLVGAIPLSAKGGSGAIAFLVVPLGLLAQFYWLIRRNDTLPSHPER